MSACVGPEHAGLFEMSGRPSLGPETEFSQDWGELAQGLGL